MYWIVLLALLFVWSPVHAATVTISGNTSGAHTGDYSGVDDGRMKEDSPTTAYGGSSSMQIAKYSTGDNNEVLINFTGIATWATAVGCPCTVTAVELGIKSLSHTGAGSQTATIYRMVRDWTEAQFTWNVYSTGNNWSTAGAKGSGTDRAASSSGTFTMGDTDDTYMVSNGEAGLISDVQGWANGTFSNYGWILERTDGSNDATARVFSTDDDSNLFRPYLTITYTVGVSSGAIPRMTLLGVN